MARQTKQCRSPNVSPISRRTMEFDFTRVYRKLGTTRRSQLRQFTNHANYTGRHSLIQER
jgi:hypothetical protein